MKWHGSTNWPDGSSARRPNGRRKWNCRECPLRCSGGAWRTYGVSRFTFHAAHFTFPVMSIVTRTGDSGMTGLMFNRRVSKCHPRVEAYGSVDELNAALGLARAAAQHDFTRDNLLAIQKDLVILMGELATGVEDLARYVEE